MAPKNLLVIMADEHNPKMLGCAEHPLVKKPAPRCIGEARDTFQSGVHELSNLRACARQVRNRAICSRYRLLGQCHSL